jgi:large repetitive protein
VRSRLRKATCCKARRTPDDPSDVLNFADVADTDSNAEEVLAVTSVNGSAANVGAAIAGTYGTLVLKADGSYTYTLNNDDPAVQGLGPQDLVTDSFTYTITDGYNDGVESATLTITIFGGSDGPIVQLPDPVRVSEEGLEGGIPDTSGNQDTTNSTTASGQIIASDADGDALTFTLNEPTGTLYSNGVAIVWSGDGTDTLVGTAGGSTIITITIDNDGNYEVELLGPVDHGNPAVEDQLTFNVTVSVSDDEETTNTTLAVTIEDDSPVVNAVAAQADSLQVDESALGIDATVNFAGLFTSNAGADGEDSTTYTLGINAGATGLVDSATGEAVTLQLVGSVVQGVISGGVIVFTVSVDASGNVTLDQQRAVRHDPNSGPDQETSLQTANLITLTATTTDLDGDSDSATVSLGHAISFRDDAPSISLADVQTPALLVDETNLAVDDSADFSGVFTSAFGADGAGSIAYALSIEGGNGTESGVVDTATGEAVLLRMNGGVVEGYTENSDDLVFTISVDGDGEVTLNQLRAVVHGDTDDDNEPTGLNTEVVTLTATITDVDGDSASAAIDLGATITFLDDGPSIDITAGDVSVVEGGTISNGTWTVNAGADGGVVKVVFDGEEYDLDEAIDTGKGTLTVNSDLTWEFVAAGNLDNPDGVTLSFDLTITDGDGDVATDSHTITITDGAGPVGGDVVALSVDEDDLPAGSNPAPKDPLSDSDGLTFNAGSDDITSIVFGATGGISVSGIEGGTTITWVASNGGRTLTGSIDGTEVIRLDLTGATSVTAGGNGVTTVTATLLAEFPHEDGPDADSLTITGIVVVATDTDGDSATGTVSVVVVDDEPIVTATGGTIENDIGETLTGLLPYDMNADGLGSLTLANPIVTANDQPLVLTSNGHTVVYQLTDENGDGVQELKAYADVDGDGFDEGDTLVFTLAATGGAEGSYTLTMHDVVDLPVPTIELSFAGISASGPVDEINVANKLLISTVDADADDLNANQGFIGIHNNIMNNGEMVRYEFGTVSGSPGAGDFDIVHQVVNDVQLSIFDVGSGNDSFTWTAYKDGGQVGTGSIVFNLGDDELTPAIHVDGGYDTLIFDVTGGMFKIGGVTYTELGDAQDVNLNIGFTGTDADGDSTSGSIDVTITAGDGAVDQAVQTLLNQDNI